MTTNRFFVRDNPHFWRNVILTGLVLLLIVFACPFGTVWLMRPTLIGPQGPAGASIKGDKGDPGQSIKGDTGSPGKDGVNGLDGKNADPNDPAFVQVMAQLVATQVAQALASTPVTPLVATAETTKVADATGGAVVTKLQDTKTMGQWDVKYYTGATSLMKGFVFGNVTPGWKEPPNTDWPAGNFLAKNGLEWPDGLADFCQQDQYCDFPVAARSFRSITADYSVAGIGSCQEAGTGIGCALLLINMGDVTASYRRQMVDTGYTITGLYWNGDKIDEAVRAWASHIFYRMVGIPSADPANPGANCSVPAGCKGVNFTFALTSGNELLVLGHAVVQP